MTANPNPSNKGEDEEIEDKQDHVKHYNIDTVSEEIEDYKEIPSNVDKASKKIEDEQDEMDTSSIDKAITHDTRTDEDAYVSLKIPPAPAEDLEACRDEMDIEKSDLDLKEFNPNSKFIKPKKPTKKKRKSFSCTLCQYKYFQRQSQLVKHIHEHNAALIPKYTCTLCKKSFDTNIELIEHKNTFKHEEESFLCVDCKLAFSHHCDWLVHNLSHSVQQLYQCMECQKYFVHKESYATHIYTHSAKTMQCTICSKLFSSEKNLKQHMKSHENKYECCECGKSFKEKYPLSKHMMHHTGVRLYQCLYCGKGFITVQQVTVHTRIHTNERPYKCDHCGNAYKQHTDWKKHACKVLKREKNFQCEMCKKKFKTDKYLAAHMLLHSDYRPFSCSQCSDKFVSFASLKAHTIFKHTTELPFACTICMDRFKIKSKLKRHMIGIHGADLPS